ncbi:MAG TPA: alkaline phosphatase family protein [Thermoplasmata archaeon]|nr:alkaline phosphatase family protein [Thermoplasmata archaeon]
MVGSSRRFLVLGLDGGTFDLLDPLFAAGELPFLHSLVHRGVRAPLRSVYPAKTIPAWFSFATGQDPGELGIFGFTEPDGRPGRSRTVRSFRPAEALWDRLSRLGLKVGVLNFPITAGYPLHGFILPGMFSDASATFPKGLRAEVTSDLGAAYPGELPLFRESERDAWVARATRAVAQRGQVAATLAARHRPDFLFALFRETDRLEHQLWEELSRPVAEIPADLLAFWRTVDTACRDVDAAFRSAGERAVTLVISDHGHGPIQSDFLTNRWLAEEKLLVFDRRSELARRQLLARLTLRTQQLPLAGRVARRIADFLRDSRHAALADLIGGDASFERAAARIDWKRTVAFSYPVPEGIYLNPFNPDLTPDKRATVLAEIRRRLEQFPDAHIEVFDPETIYRGRNLGSAPALLIRVDDMRTEPRMDFGYPKSLIKERPRFFYGSGTHRMDGILIAAGDGIQPGPWAGKPNLLDIAPTVLEGMGLPSGPAMAGRSFARELGLTA